MFKLSRVSCVGPEGPPPKEEDPAAAVATPSSSRSSRNSSTKSSRSNYRSRRGRNNVYSRRGNKVEPNTSSSQQTTPSKPHDAPMSKSDLYFALDCEMVGVGPDGVDSALARVSIVNWDSEIVLDTFVKVSVPVTDYRTYVSGVTQKDLESPKAMEFEDCRLKVKNILCGKILIGHGLENDLNALHITHPRSDVRDTAAYGPLMREITVEGGEQRLLLPRKLRDLAWEKLERQIQVEGIAHSPVEDAITALDLYKSVRPGWEKDLVKEAMQKEREAVENQQRLRMESQMYALNLNGGMPPPIPMEHQRSHPLEHQRSLPLEHQRSLPQIAASSPREGGGYQHHKVYYNRGYPPQPVQYVTTHSPPESPHQENFYERTPPPDAAYPQQVYHYATAPPPPPQANSSFFRLPLVPVYLLPSKSSRRARRQQQQQMQMQQQQQAMQQQQQMRAPEQQELMAGAPAPPHVNQHEQQQQLAVTSPEQ